MEHRTILLVEDNANLNEINRRALESEGYIVLTAASLAIAREQLVRVKPDVILLDVLMPDGNGIDFCGEIRTLTDAHILFLTSRSEHEDRIRALDTGGDDYITKPYRLDEMLSRVRAALRRRNMESLKFPKRIIAYGSLTLDTVAGRAFIHGADILVNPKEFAILRLLVENRGMTVTKEILYREVWRQPMNDDSNALKYQISRLRKKLEGSGYMIVSEYGEGYRFELKHK